MVTPNFCRHWKGTVLPLEEIDRIEVNPSLQKLGFLGLVEQPLLDLKNKKSAA